MMIAKTLFREAWKVLGAALALGAVLAGWWYVFGSSHQPVATVSASGMTCDMGISAAKAGRAASISNTPVTAVQSSQQHSASPRINPTPPLGPVPTDMVWIPGGEFWMGADEFPDAQPWHRVYVDGFWMDKTEVTNEQFVQFVGATHYVTVPERAPRAEDFPGAPDPLDIGSAYGEAKRAAELLCALYAQRNGMEIKIARCFAFAGPGLPLDGAFALGNFIRDALAGGPIRVQGDGTARRSYLDVVDLAHWLRTILLQGKPGRAYNVGSEHDISLTDLAHTVARTINPDAAITIAQAPVPGRPPARYVPSTARARGELGLRENISLPDAILRTAGKP